MSVEPGWSCDEAFTSRFPVHRACRDGDVGALASLLQPPSDRTHLSAEDSCYGWTPIHWAAHYGQLECVMRLVQMGCDVNAVTSRFNQTPTHTAAFGGHPHCVVWLTEAGADVNQQDLVGEAPIHKAARSGSLECIQVLLVAGAKPHLRNASGQTAADLAHAHGSHDCFHLITGAQKHLMQHLHANGVQYANGAPCGQGVLGGAAGRKRLQTAAENGHMKKAKRDVLMAGNGAEEPDSMNVELDTADISSSHQLPPPPPPAHQDDSAPMKSFSARDKAPSPPANQQQQQAAVAARRRPPADMCGSLHMTGSPSSCVSHRPYWWGLMGAEYGDFLHYGHYHGFGDTAEELSIRAGVQAQQRHSQAAASSNHLYHGS